MLKIYSKVYPDKLCHMVYRSDDLSENREDVAPEDQFIQVSALKLEAGKTFRPHRHIWKNAPRKQVVAQESWCVMEGKVKAHCVNLQRDTGFSDTDWETVGL